MRVGLDLSPLGYGNLMRGIGIYAENLVVALAEIDVRTQYVLLIARPSREIDWLKNLPENFRLTTVTAPPLGRAAPLVSHQIILPIQARRLGLDILHCIDVPTNPSHPGVPYWQTVPTIVTVHDLTPLVMGKRVATRWRHRLFYRFMLQACRRAAHLMADSQNSAGDIERHGLADKSRITVARLAAPRFDGGTEALSPRLAGISKTLYVLHVGGADRVKNQATVLRAFGLLCRDPEFKHRLVLVGACHLGDEIATAVEPRAAERIVRLTNLTREEMKSLYQSAAVFVFPSFYEGFGLPILESMSLGVPVVASRTSAIPEVAGEAAILVDPENAEELASAVRRLLFDPELSAQYIQAGYQQVRRFSWIETARQTREVYERVAAAGRKVDG